MWNGPLLAQIPISAHGSTYIWLLDVLIFTCKQCKFCCMLCLYFSQHTMAYFFYDSWLYKAEIKPTKRILFIIHTLKYQATFDINRNFIYLHFIYFKMCILKYIEYTELMLFGIGYYNSYFISTLLSLFFILLSSYS